MCVKLLFVVLHWILLDPILLDWIGLDWIGLDWIGLDWITFIVLYCIVFHVLMFSSAPHHYLVNFNDILIMGLIVSTGPSTLSIITTLTHSSVSSHFYPSSFCLLRSPFDVFSSVSSLLSSICIHRLTVMGQRNP